ncbi:alpha/beta fold hydrolase [Benzoatithermus flavus]|uniref:Alpha/beta fold hydrolase n=1 Tax=Benzoatithermus flavus TaxID=3108223 RepID=A0ABU8XTU5_9PROT
MMRDEIVLLPGLLCDHRLFQAQIPALAVHAGVMVADLTRDASIPAMAERVLAAAPPRFALAGLSMGGYVALEIVRRAPERVMRLALLDSQARPDSEETRSRRRGLMQLAEKGEFQGVSPRLLPLFIHRDRLSDTSLTGMVQNMALSVGKDAFLRQQTAIMARADSRPHLPAIRCPTLVLAGREDVVTPPELQLEMAAAIPNATLVLLPRCGHLAPLEQPQAVTRQLLVWLEA